ncbi:helix-turn-helix domain-containing protein [Arthrobacter sp. Br18]|uniref:helix-turn-helix domain-containing protein n=1 Tax=Arthrobacter sp. Br18 TaxID=1312954 RepID=UPI00047CF5AA|nr:helix-turn-helix domain-containing protein [Arthrobacter sp. Br18]
MPTRTPRTTPALTPREADALRHALADSADVTVFVDGTAFRLPAAARNAVVDLLERLGDGNTVQCVSVAEMLTTSQAAELAGISHTYLRNLTDAGTIPAEYRGSHRRIRRSDVEHWLELQPRSASEAGA